MFPKFQFKYRIQFQDYFICGECDEFFACELNKNFKKKAVFIIHGEPLGYTVNFSKVLYIEFEKLG